MFCLNPATALRICLASRQDSQGNDWFSSVLPKAIPCLRVHLSAVRCSATLVPALGFRTHALRIATLYQQCHGFSPVYSVAQLQGYLNLLLRRRLAKNQKSALHTATSFLSTFSPIAEFQARRRGGFTTRHAFHFSRHTFDEVLKSHPCHLSHFKWHGWFFYLIGKCLIDDWFDARYTLIIDVSLHLNWRRLFLKI
jgi:hypothetical protein